MYNVTVDSLKKVHGANAVDVFNEISKLGGYGITASNFDAHDGGLAVNATTQNFDKIKSLISGSKTENKDGK